MITYRAAQSNESFFVAFLGGGHVHEYFNGDVAAGGSIQMIAARLYRRDTTPVWRSLEGKHVEIYEGEVHPGDTPNPDKLRGHTRLEPMGCLGIPANASRLDSITRCVAGLTAGEVQRERSLLAHLDSAELRDTTVLIVCTTENARRPCLRGGSVYTLVIGPQRLAGDRAAFPMLVGRRNVTVSLLVGAASFVAFFLWDFRGW